MQCSRNNSTLPIDTEIPSKAEKKSDITYGIDDNPPWYLCLFLAIQVIFLNIISNI